MKCKMCGAQLKNDGDICKNCYNEYLKDEELKKELKSDKNIILRLHRKYIPLYQLTRYGDYYFLSLIVLLTVFSNHFIIWGILTLILMISILIIILAYNKYKAKNTICIFRENQIIWKYKDTIKALEYSNLDDVTYYQNFFQKRFNLADVQFRPLKGNYIMNGFEVKNVPNFDENWGKICEIIISKRKT